MAIIGIESVTYSVDDVKTNFKFWADYGLYPIFENENRAELDCQNGARIILKKFGADVDDLSKGKISKNYETIWGVDTQENLDKLIANIRKDRECQIDSDGIAHFVAEGGMHMGLKVWQPKPFVSSPDQVNAPGAIVRLNQHRKWRLSCRPKCINHIVFFVPDYVQTWEWFRDVLNFRYTDHSKGIGAFVRADGCFEHHNMFFVSMDLPISPEKPGFMHLSFGLEDIDELMLGVRKMKDKGWAKDGFNTKYGLCRHRISSAMYYYFDIPAGGEAEYNVDSDYVDDNWIPRAWEFKFGSLLWATDVHELWQGEVAMDMTFDPDGASLEPFRKSKPQAAQ